MIDSLRADSYREESSNCQLPMLPSECYFVCSGEGNYDNCGAHSWHSYLTVTARGLCCECSVSHFPTVRGKEVAEFVGYFDGSDNPPFKWDKWRKWAK